MPTRNVMRANCMQGLIEGACEDQRGAGECVPGGSSLRNDVCGPDQQDLQASAAERRRHRLDDRLAFVFETLASHGATTRWTTSRGATHDDVWRGLSTPFR